MKNLYNEIIKISNIRAAYLELAEKFDESSKSSKYSGIDGLKLKDVDNISEELFLQIQKELIELTSITHVIQYSIPKSSGNGMRDIFIYTVKERIKAQAIYRVVEPIFEEAYSEFLFSYRKTKPSYFAARSCVRRYKRRYDQDYLLLIDFAAYSDFIDHKILIEKLEKLQFDKDTMSLLKLFINVNVFNKNRAKNKEYGLMQGVPLIALFANIYLNDLDHQIGKKVQFYRRVGDDLIIADPNKEKLDEIFKEIIEISKTHRLQIKKEKTKLIKNSENFNFLGYTFKNNMISIKNSGIKRIILRWKNMLQYNTKTEKQKIKYIKTLFKREQNNLDTQFKEIVRQYMFVDDQGQIKDLYNTFIKLVVKFIYKTYSERNHRLTLEALHPYKMPSLYKYFIDLHNGKKI